MVNSLSGELLERTLDIVAEFCRFVEIGKKDILDNNYMGLRTFERCISFTSVDLRQRLLKRPQEAQRFLASITERLESGGISPIAGTEVPRSDVASGLRKLQTGDNIGKVVVIVSPTDTVLAEPPRAGGKLLSDNATYVITGGTGGIGRSLALWMLEHGAKHIILLGRSGSSRSEIAELTQKHLGVRAVACDVASRASLEEALKSIHDLPPVRGVIHGALYLRVSHQDWGHAMLNELLLMTSHRTPYLRTRPSTTGKRSLRPKSTLLGICMSSFLSSTFSSPWHRSLA